MYASTFGPNKFDKNFRQPNSFVEGTRAGQKNYVARSLELLRPHEDRRQTAA